MHPTHGLVVASDPSAPTFWLLANTQLSTQHQRYLLERGVPIEWAAPRGFRTVDAWLAAKLLGFKRKTVVSGGLAIPMAGDYWIVRQDVTVDGRKFLYPAASPTMPYLPPLADPGVWSNPTVPLVIVEGPVKAASLTCAGIHAIGLAGATGGGHDSQKRRDEGVTELHPFLRHNVVWAGRQVTIMMDSDAWTNSTVRLGENIVATALTDAGAIVLIARVPVFPTHPKLGPDDYLVRVGPVALRQHLATARRWSPPKKRNDWPRWSPKRQVELETFLKKHLPERDRVQAHELYVAYGKWCDDLAVPQLSETLFGAKVPKIVQVTKTTSRGKIYWRRGGG
ncbi:MAG: DUF3854 domain-containing protein [Myxococcus sp.]|nr:DUF3854 domain-containing protein [Myxococcus sp.]